LQSCGAQACRPAPSGRGGVRAVNARLAKIWPRWASRRVRISFYSILAGIVAGFTSLLLPLEDVAIMTRAMVRSQPAPQTVVVVGIDDRTLDALGSKDAGRAQKAIVVRKLLDAGAKRVFFDRMFRFEEDPQGDNALVGAFADAKGKVFIAVGATASDDPFGRLSDIPAAKFRKDSHLVGITGLFHPFGMGASFPVEWDTTEGRVPGMAAQLADRTPDSLSLRWLEPLSGMPKGFYRPDYSYDYRTIPTLSFIDVLGGAFDPATVAGKDVLIGATSRVFNDHHSMPGTSTDVPGVYFHAIASYTYAKPLLTKLGWLPALLLVSIVVVVRLRRRRSLFGWSTASAALAVITVPFVLDGYGIELEIAPAILVGSIALFRSWSLEQVETASEINITSGLPSLQQLKVNGVPGAGNLVALKLRNYGAIVASFETGVEARLAQEIARRVRLGDRDAVIYHEGDKFLWLSQVENPVDILEHLEGLHRLVQGGVVIEGRDVDLSFNCGVDTDRSQQIERRIANALQSAEQAVREDELVCIHDASSTGVHWEISMLSALDRAIDVGHVWVAYQAKLDLASGRIKGAEALARWTDPERGPISPDKFIQIAEEYHRIDRITRFVLGEAIRTARDIRAIIPDFTISVNISAQLLRYAGLTDMILDALRVERMPPDCLVLEITETDRLDRSSKTYAMMESLVNAGLELSIDDFGTGNATIDYMRFLPAAEIKIDKMFVGTINTDRKDLLLVQSIIEMAHSLDRRVVAEGVENAEILDALESIGCDQIQGYHIGRPMRREDFFATLAKTARVKTG
jgi:EAL domain-containing protein (putative c-di-GMP-specific phosphodiesterase class I)/CHASE2 domain-containing sensor protein